VGIPVKGLALDGDVTFNGVNIRKVCSLEVTLEGKGEAKHWKKRYWMTSKQELHLIKKREISSLSAGQQYLYTLKFGFKKSRNIFENVISCIMKNGADLSFYHFGKQHSYKK